MSSCHCETRQFLVFGGNGFIGYEFVNKLLENSISRGNQPRLHVTLINRGKSWDWDKLSVISKYDDCITRIRWDRKQSLNDCNALLELIDKVRYFSAVIDFSAYKKSAIADSLSFVKAKCLLYVYLSTDSVYEVCEKRHSGSTKEKDAMRPTNLLSRAKLNRRDRYGHRKLECEELLVLQEQYSDPVPYVIFRLPDVFGPRDSTNRLWQYILWLQLCNKLSLPMYIPAQLENQKISLTYVSDVASLLVDIVCSEFNSALYKNFRNQIFNLALVEQLTVHEVLTSVIDELDLKGVRIEYSSNPDVPVIYPSVNLGPIDTAKAHIHLLWNPMSFSDSLKETISFYNSVASFRGFSAEKLDCIDEVLDDLEGVYNVKLLSRRSELKQVLKAMLCVD